MAGARIQGLDMLRGVAILLVMLRHSFPEVFGGAGIVGVVMFFALSGYLITAILHRDIVERGRVSYGRFYRNRALRLFPALVFVVAGIVVATLVFDPLGDRGVLGRTVLVALSYTGNLPFDHGGGAIGHLWTLATEEQFYLVWPLLLVLGVRWRRLRVVVALAGVAIMAACVVTLVVAAPSYWLVYTYPASWAVAMVIGAAGFLGRDRVARVLPRAGSGASSPAALGVGVLAVAVLLILSFVPELKNFALAYVVAGPVIAVVTVVLINYVRHWRVLPSAALRPLLWLGVISYAAYLWNFPISLWLLGAGYWVHAIGTIVLTVVAAGVSLVVVERPFQRLKARLEARARQSEVGAVVDELSSPSSSSSSA